MKPRIGVVMDPIAAIHYHKDTTLALLWEMQQRQAEIYYFEQQDLFLRDGKAYGQAKKLTVFRDPEKWFVLQPAEVMPLEKLKTIFMRKDPPFDMEYIYTTYLLEHAERDGVKVINRPQALRDANEKLFATWFPECMPPTLVTRDSERLQAFLDEQGEIVCKPLHGMGGTDVFRLHQGAADASAVFALQTQQGNSYTMAQKFIPAIREGDKRILIIDGEAFPHALARIPQGKEWRGNLALGAKGVAQPLTEHDQWICSQVGPVLREKGLFFVGLDVIGDYLTEINVTSPTGMVEIAAQTDCNPANVFMDALERKCAGL